jgi:hypothetical protein
LSRATKAAVLRGSATAAVSAGSGATAEAAAADALALAPIASTVDAINANRGMRFFMDENSFSRISAAQYPKSVSLWVEYLANQKLR